MMKLRNAFAKRLGFQNLEEKIPLAADVGSLFLADIVAGDLVITNIESGVDNDITIDLSPFQSFTIVPSGDTEVSIGLFDNVTFINGQTGDESDFEEIVLTGFTGDVRIDVGSAPIPEGETASFAVDLALVESLPGGVFVSGATTFIDLDVDAFSFISDDAELPFTTSGDIEVVNNLGTAQLGLFFDDEGLEVDGDVRLSGSAVDPTADVFALALDVVTIAGDLTVETDAGNDTLVFQDNVTILGTTTINTGAGDDVFDISPDMVGPLGDPLVAVGPVTIETGAGNDTLEFVGSVIEGDFTIDTGDGDDLAEFIEVQLGSNLSLISGEGVDEINVFGDGEAEIAGDILLELGPGENESELGDLVVLGDVTIKTTGEENQAEVGFSAIGGDVVVLGGDGLDEVEILENEIAGDLFLSGGGGENAFGLIEGSVENAVVLTGTDGGSEVELLDLTVRNDLVVISAAGDFINDFGSAVGGSATFVALGATEIALENSAVTGSLILVGSGEADTIAASGLSVGGSLIATTGAGDDVVTLGDSQVGNAFLLLGSGDDSLTFTGETLVDGFAFLSGGSGIDELNNAELLDAAFALDFGFEEFDVDV